MQKKESKKNTLCGYIAIVGKPNVGKSTLLNHIIGEKISITAKKPQTTRYKILGIKTEDNTQMIYVDTPGIYQIKKKKDKNGLNKYMLKTALSSIYDVDIILFVISATTWNKDDEWIIAKIKKLEIPTILVVNKIDLLSEKTDILPIIETLKEKMEFCDIVPLSAKKNINIAPLESKIKTIIPKGPFLFPEDELTDRDTKFTSREIIREKLIRFLGEELPYAVNVEIEKFEKKETILNIHAVIWVEKENQKAIVIGASGQKLKTVGTAARKDLEKILDQKIFLRLWVKVKKNWSDDERLLKEGGYF